MVTSMVASTAVSTSSTCQQLVMKNTTDKHYDKLESKTEAKLKTVTTRVAVIIVGIILPGGDIDLPLDL